MERVTDEMTETHDAATMFWYVVGFGLLDRAEFLALRERTRRIKSAVIVLPPYWEDDLPLGSVPDLPPEVEAAGLECIAEALFRRLRADGKLRALEAKASRAEALLDSTRQLLRETRASAQ